MELLNDILRYLGVGILFINTVLFFNGRNSFKRIPAYLVFEIYLLFSLIISVIILVLSEYKLDNLYLSHVYFIIQFVLLSIFYIKLLKKKQKKTILIIGGIISITLGIQYTVDPDLVHQFNLFEVLITSLPLVFYSLMYLYNLLNEKGFFQYVNAGILVYLSVSTLIFILGNVLTDIQDEVARNIWFIHKVMYIIFLIFIFLEWKYGLLPYKARVQ